MSKITNLSRFRKQKARDDRRARGDANAATHGRTLAEKDRARQEADKLARHVEGHRRDRDNSNEYDPE